MGDSTTDLPENLGSCNQKFGTKLVPTLRVGTS